MRVLKLVRKFSLIVQYYIKSNWDDVKAQLKRIVFSYHRSEERAQVLGRVTVLTYHALIVYILSLRLVYHEKRYRGFLFDFSGAISLVSFELTSLKAAIYRDFFQGPLKQQE